MSLSILGSPLAATLLLAAFAAPPRQEALIAAERQEIESSLVADLSELAEWCNEAKLFADRDQAYAQILLFDPEHERSRKFLRYRKNADGSWTQSGEYRKPKNRSEAALPELSQRRGRVHRRFAEAMVALADRHQLTLDEKGRKEIYAAVLAVDPDAPEIRERTREVKEGDQWQLRETFRAKERREELRLFVEEGLAQAPTPKQGTLLPAEESLGVDWLGVEETAGCESSARSRRMKSLAPSRSSRPPPRSSGARCIPRPSCTRATRSSCSRATRRRPLSCSTIPW
jgi:hypothetical protein